MLASFLMGLVGGQRAMTPLATVAIASARGELPADNGAPRILAHPIVAAGTLLLAAGEMAGDKQKTAPDRIVAIGLIARFITSAIAGAALVPRRDRWAGAAIGGVTAVIASYPGWRARMAALAQYGQTPTGFVEDTAVLAGAAAIVRNQARLAGRRFEKLSADGLGMTRSVGPHPRSCRACRSTVLFSRSVREQAPPRISARPCAPAGAGAARSA